MGIFHLIFFEFMQKFNIPYVFIYVLWYFLNFIIITFVLLFTVIILVLFERKFLALFTRRKGPNRVGYRGCLQTIADAIKLLFKENIYPSGAEKFLYFFSPLLVFTPIVFAWFLIPFSSGIYIYNSDCSILLFMAVISIAAAGILIAGYSSGNNYSLIGGIRACIQSISSEIPIFTVLASIALFSGSLNMENIITTQSKSILYWNIFPNILGFIIFFICSLIVMNRIPFDFPEAESELVAGYNCEYSGIKFAMFFLGEYALTFILCVFMSVIFLGGYNSPFGFYFSDLLNLNIIWKEILKNSEQIMWLISKTFILIMLIILIRASYPRLKPDKTLNFCWYILIPLSFFNLFIISFIKLIKEGL